MKKFLRGMDEKAKEVFVFAIPVDQNYENPKKVLK